MASMEEPVPTEPEADTSQNPLFQELQVAIKELMTLVNIPLQEVEAGANVWGRGRGQGCEHGAGGCSRQGTACLALLVGLEHPDFSSVQTEGDWGVCWPRDSVHRSCLSFPHCTPKATTVNVGLLLLPRGLVLGSMRPAQLCSSKARWSLASAGLELQPLGPDCMERNLLPPCQVSAGKEPTSPNDRHVLLAGQLGGHLPVHH